MGWVFGRMELVEAVRSNLKSPTARDSGDVSPWSLDAKSLSHSARAQGTQGSSSLPISGVVCDPHLTASFPDRGRDDVADHWIWELRPARH